MTEALYLNSKTPRCNLKPVSVEQIGKLESGAAVLSRVTHLAGGDDVSMEVTSDAAAINQARARLGCAGCRVDSQQLFDAIDEAQTHAWYYPYGAPVRIWKCTMAVSGKGSKRQVVPTLSDVLVTTGTGN